jgi:hypothetical protein
MSANWTFSVDLNLLTLAKVIVVGLPFMLLILFCRKIIQKLWYVIRLFFSGAFWGALAPWLPICLFLGAVLYWCNSITPIFVENPKGTAGFVGATSAIFGGVIFLVGLAISLTIASERME